MKIKIILLLLFLLINAFNYFIIQVNSKDKIDIILAEHLLTLKTHYKIISHMQKTTASTVYQSTQESPRILEILSQANMADKEKKAELRKELYKLLHKKYEILKQQGVLQYQFLLPNNESFYRAHKPSKFGDDLTDIREDFEYVNRTKIPVRAFTQGRTSHGFRNTFPLFNNEGAHIGAVEISFSSDNIQTYLTAISNIHSHFLVDKNIFTTKAWLRDDLVLKYDQSAEHKNYMLVLNGIHTKEICLIDNKKKLKPIRQTLNTKIELQKAFSLYVNNPSDKNHIEVISFVPIKNIDDTISAWIVSYEKNPLIESILLNALILKIASLLTSLLFVYLLFKGISSQQKIKEQSKLVNDVLNATDNIMLITDFKDIKFANNKLKELLHISKIEQFNELHSHPLLQIFQEKDGYLHQNLLKENEDFVSLLARTPAEDRVVSILDEHYDSKSFKISVTKTQDQKNYLITLSDITKMREQRIEDQRKASIDGLTNIYNRNKFDEILVQEIEYTKRYQTPLSIAVLDIDKFKDFNDNYGHLIGDEVLIQLAKTIQEQIRETDVFARWGGEEFVLLFRNTNSLNAQAVAEKFKDLIEEQTHPIAGKVTASFGVSQFKKGDTTTTLFKRCDEALYKAKENGRNRVEVL